MIRIRSYSDPHFPTFGLNTERLEVSFRIQSECRKIKTRIIPNTGTFHAVYGSQKTHILFWHILRCASYDWSLDIFKKTFR